MKIFIYHCYCDSSKLKKQFFWSLLVSQFLYCDRSEKKFTSWII